MAALLAYLEAHTMEVCVVLFVGAITWQLLSGVAWATGKWYARSPAVRREDNPGEYWLRLGVQAAVLVFIVWAANSRGWWASSKSGSGSASRGGSASASATAAPATAAESQVERQRSAAFALHRAENYSQAVVLYDSVLAVNDSDSEVHFFRGVALWKLGYNAFALAAFKRTIAMDDTNFTANQYADRIMSSQGKWDELIVMWTEFIRKNPNNASAYFERAGTYFQKRDMTAALTDATKACDLQLAAACALKTQLGGK